MRDPLRVAAWPDLLACEERRNLAGRLDLPLTDAAEGYRAMDERRAIKTLLRP